MANVLHHHIDFHPRPVSHAPSPFGFGFGLSAPPSSPLVSPGWQPSSTPGHSNPAAFHQLASSMNQQASSSRVQKRRHEPEDEVDEVRDHSMDRSPTPERPKRAAPKRARMINATDLKDSSALKENKSPNNSEEDDVDIGVLLASLPSQSLLPLLTALMKAHPSLKSSILPLIPRPTLETAIQVLAQSAKRLRDAYPYSTSPSPSTTSFGFGRPLNPPAFGQSNQTNSQNTGGMRDSYIQSRLRPHVNEFVATCMSYLPYFTCLPPSSQSNHTGTIQSSQSTTTIQSLHKDKFHPDESFLFLSAVTNHIISQQSLAQSLLAPMLLPRLGEEWRAWVDRVDEVVNRHGGMFGGETVRGWERGLDEIAGAKITEGSNIMREVRDKWVTKVGWLVGRMIQQPMDE
ncbi:hypothetical protein BDQ12DRAFT_704000 [Crucibulum laeve]|uniref:Tethering factor for nuclear proteasome STS1 n=1 Tax=Crucibulum laeve TaxID=68775 RepID=A0A5C3M8R3_9AGAR|nr:hypothetical protein BDQ12DRAFT_704000 [Crucibulum laeve]